jgi:hypothetical protein
MRTKINFGGRKRMRLSIERLSAEVLDHIKKWYAKCEEADCMPEKKPYQQTTTTLLMWRR